LVLFLELVLPWVFIKDKD